MIRIAGRYLFLVAACCWSGPSIPQNIVTRRIDSLLLVLKGASEDTGRVLALNMLSRELRMASDYERTIEYANAALSLADKLNYKKGKAATYSVLGAVERDKGNYPAALRFYHLSLQLSQEIGDQRGIAISYGNMGIIYDAQGNYPDGLKSHLASLTIMTAIGDKQGIAGAYNNLGNIYKDQGNYPEALKNQLAALKLNEEVGYKQGIASSFNNIGIIYEIQGNYAEALNYHFASLKIKEEIGEKLFIAGSYYNIGVIYEKQGNYREALTYHLMSLKLKEATGSKRAIANSYDAIGIIYLRSGNYPAALQSHLASLKLKEEIGAKEGVAITSINVGNVINKQATTLDGPGIKGAYKEAIGYFNKGLLLAQETGLKEALKDAYRGLGEAYRGLGDYKKALENTNLYIGLKDSLNNNETTQTLEKLRTSYEVEKAISQEKAQQEKILADQKVNAEKVLAEKNTKHELEIAGERLANEKAIEIEKLKYAFAIAEERREQEKLLAEQDFQSEQKLAGATARLQQDLMAEKANQEKKEELAKTLREKEQVERERRNELIIIGVAVLGIITLFLVLLNRQRSMKKRAIERADALHKMAELELQSLRAQLNPHFMFNSLNAIQNLILKEDTNGSHLYLSRFSKLLRILLDNANQPFVSIKKEMDFLELYLSLENLRIPDLRVTIEKDPGINMEERLIPNMMLQPYIENAIWHGLSHKKGDRQLQLRIHGNAHATEFEIEDNGVGRKKAAELKSRYSKGHHSKGMELLSKRFNLLSREYGATISTTVSDLDGNGEAAGTLVHINVPLSLSEQANALMHDTNDNN